MRPASSLATKEHNLEDRVNFSGSPRLVVAVKGDIFNRPHAPPPVCGEREPRRREGSFAHRARVLVGAASRRRS